MKKKTHHPTRIGSLLTSLATLVVASCGLFTLSSTALFDDVQSASMDVSSGWVDVALGGSTVVALSNLKPGDVLFRSMNVANIGSLDFSYALTASRPTNTGSPLVDAMQVETWRTANAEACAAATYQTGTRVATTTSLTSLNVTNANLGAGTSETLCMRLSLPSSTPNGIAGKTATVTLTVASQQIL